MPTRSNRLIWLSLLIAMLVLPAIQAAAIEEVVDRDGRNVVVLGEDGATLSTQIHPEAPSKTAGAPPPSGPKPEEIVLEDPSGARRVEPDGTVTPEATWDGLARTAAVTSNSTGTATIDRMTLRGGYGQTYRPVDTIALLGSADHYFLSDGTSWGSGAGSHYTYGAYVDRVEVEGDTVRYYLTPSTETYIYRQIDYDSGDHSSVGILGAGDELYLEATLGSTTATLRGGAVVVENAPANYAEPRFNYWSAVVGAVVPFEQTYLHTSGTWQEDTFDYEFSYRRTGGSVDFANPISVPLLVGLEIKGSGTAPTDSEVSYAAVGHYDNGIDRNVTDVASWSVEPASLASIDAGRLITGSSAPEGATLEISASHTADGVTVDAQKVVDLVERGTIDVSLDAWPTYQGNHGHTGYVPIQVDPQDFTLRWERVVADGFRLHQVAAGDGRVFVSRSLYHSDGEHIYALDARDGETLWSRGFGRVSRVNPPAYAYDTVYIQTGKESSSGQPAYLNALDPESGDIIFQSRVEEQWESHLAPTPYDGRVYVNGGYYGGMYGFDAFSGDTEWFLDLPQYDEWTPAVDEIHAYAYVGEYSPGLYVADRATGALLFRIPDDDFDWRGWSMDLAPVLGGRDDVFAIHNGRLIRFDVAGRQIAWQLKRSFTGQPSIREGVVFAIDGGALFAVDQDTGDTLWSWSAPGGDALVSQIIVTDSHLFVRSDTTTYAVELLSRQSQWSHPGAGEMALGNETLYISQTDGTLTAISMPEYSPVPPSSITIEGPVEALEFTSTSLTASVTYEDGRVRDRTGVASWEIEPTEGVSLSDDGELTIGELFVPEAVYTVRVSYEENGTTVSDDHDVVARISVPVEDLVRRNLEAAKALREGVMPALDEARMREQAALENLERIRSGGLSGPPSSSGARRVIAKLRRALFWGVFTDHTLGRNVEELEGAIDELDTPDEEAPPKRPWWMWWPR
jgi:outer membrane protein assembly factor BamB